MSPAGSTGRRHAPFVGTVWALTAFLRPVGTLRVLAATTRWPYGPCIPVPAMKPRGDDRHAQFVVEPVVGHGAEYDLRVFVGRLVNDRRRIVNFMKGHLSPPLTSLPAFCNPLPACSGLTQQLGHFWPIGSLFNPLQRSLAINVFNTVVSTGG